MLKPPPAAAAAPRPMPDPAEPPCDSTPAEEVSSPVLSSSSHPAVSDPTTCNVAMAGTEGGQGWSNVAHCASSTIRHAKLACLNRLAPCDSTPAEEVSSPVLSSSSHPAMREPTTCIYSQDRTASHARGHCRAHAGARLFEACMMFDADSCPEGCRRNEPSQSRGTCLQATTMPSASAQQ